MHRIASYILVFAVSLLAATGIVMLTSTSYHLMEKGAQEYAKVEHQAVALVCAAIGGAGHGADPLSVAVSAALVDLRARVAGAGHVLHSVLRRGGEWSDAMDQPPFAGAAKVRRFSRANLRNSPS